MINDKSEFLKSLSKEEFNDALIRVAIMDDDEIFENLWAYQSRDGDKSTAILVNSPISYYPFLHWGSEVKLKYNREVVMLDNDWIDKELDKILYDLFKNGFLNK